MTKGVYGAFSKQTGECIYVGKSGSSVQSRWTAHQKNWKADRPIHRQQLLTQYLYFFGDQIEWKMIFDLEDMRTDEWQYDDKALLDAFEREVFFHYKPIANTYIPNGWELIRLQETGGKPYAISEWNPYTVEIRVKKGQFASFADNKPHFVDARIILPLT